MTHFILNTRPKNQSDNLSHLIEKNGGKVFHFPVIEINHLKFHPVKTDDFDYLIFLSQNAVNHFFKDHHPHENLGSAIVAIGPATQHALIKLGFNNVISPADVNSEGILKLSELKNCKNKSILIISGENPKPLLTNELKKRGAHITAIFCYQRKPISYDINTVFPELLNNNINIIVSTSLESFFCLIKLFKTHEHQQWLLSKTLCVISDAMAMAAKNTGFRHIIQADNATDGAIAKTISLTSLK